MTVRFLTPGRLFDIFFSIYVRVRVTSCLSFASQHLSASLHEYSLDYSLIIFLFVSTHLNTWTSFPRPRFRLSTYYVFHKEPPIPLATSLAFLPLQFAVIKPYISVMMQIVTLSVILSFHDDTYLQYSRMDKFRERKNVHENRHLPSGKSREQKAR